MYTEQLAVATLTIKLTAPQITLSTSYNFILAMDIPSTANSTLAATEMSIMGLNVTAYIRICRFLMCVSLVAEFHLHQLRAMGPASVFTWKIRMIADMNG